MSKTTYRDRNGNTRQKWKRYSYSDREVEYVRNEGNKSLFVKTYPEWKKDQHKEAPYRWVIQDKNLPSCVVNASIHLNICFGKLGLL